MQTTKPMIWVAGLCALLVISQPAYSQIASAPLDPTKPTYSAAANGWKKTSSVFGSFADGGGEEFINGVKDNGLSTKRSTAGFAFPMEMMVLSGSTASLDMQNSSPSISNTPAGKLTKIKIESSRAGLAIGDREMVSIGLGGSSSYERLNYDEVKVSGVQGSFSMKFGENFYLGALFESNESTLSKQDSPKQSVKTKATGAGVAVILGEESPNVFRLEVGSVLSDEGESGTLASLDYHYVPKVSTSFVDVEIMMRGLLFSYASEVVEKKAGGLVGASDIKMVVDTSGVLWAPVGGVSLGFYFNNMKIQDSTAEYLVQDFTIKLGYIF